jgi:hypothetical protein
MYKSQILQGSSEEFMVCDLPTDICSILIVRASHIVPPTVQRRIPATTIEKSGTTTIEFASYTQLATGP